MTNKLTYNRLLMIVFLSLTAFLLTGCMCHNAKNKYVFIEDDHKGWNPYCPGQEVVFKSDSGALDTLTVNNYKHDTVRASKLDCGKWEYWEVIECKLKSANQQYWFEPELENRRVAIFTNEPTYDMTYYNYNDNKFTTSNDTYFNAKTINGKKYTDVIQAKCNEDDACSPVIQFHYAKNTGLVSFTTSDSIRWFKKQ